MLIKESQKNEKFDLEKCIESLKKIMATVDKFTNDLSKLHQQAISTRIMHNTECKIYVPGKSLESFLNIAWDRGVSEEKMGTLVIQRKNSKWKMPYNFSGFLKEMKVFGIDFNTIDNIIFNSHKYLADVLLLNQDLQNQGVKILNAEKIFNFPKEIVSNVLENSPMHL